MKLTEEAEEWCREHEIPVNSFNVITALIALGYEIYKPINEDMKAQQNAFGKHNKSVIPYERP
jgi:hypothetical protein